MKINNYIISTLIAMTVALSYSYQGLLSVVESANNSRKQTIDFNFANKNPANKIQQLDIAEFKRIQDSQIPEGNTTQVASSKNIVDSSNQDTADFYKKQYLDSSTVKQLVLIEQSKENITKATLKLFVKEDNIWNQKLSCEAWLGKNGIDKKQEGDGRTPTGDFGITSALGIKDNPGTSIAYTKITDTMYLCGDEANYNKLIDTSLVNHKCSNGEHLISYVPQYNYIIFIDYNKECIYPKGSAIFIHCNGTYGYTLGCISISESNMIKLLQHLDDKARICIYSSQ